MAHKMPDSPRGICDLIEPLCQPKGFQQNAAAYVEEVGGYIGGAGAPGSAMFNFGEGYGVIQGILTVLRIPYTLVRPQRWQKELGLGNKEKVRAEKICGGIITTEERKRVAALKSAAKKEWKNKLKARAEREYPHLKVTLANCDALLILSYGKLQP